MTSTYTPAYINLATLYNKAAASGKLLDVSDLTDKGTGGVTILPPKPGGKSRKVGIEGVPIVSNNYQKYLLAMQILGNDYLPNADLYLAKYGNMQLQQQPGVVGTQKLDPYTRLVTQINLTVDGGKVLDVSTLNPDGTGSLSIKPRINEGVTTKKAVDGMPYIVSNNYDSYALAMSILGPDYAQFSNAYMAKYGNAKFTKPVKALKSTVTVRSPIRQTAMMTLNFAIPDTGMKYVQPVAVPLNMLPNTKPPVSYPGQTAAIATYRPASPPRATAAANRPMSPPRPTAMIIRPASPIRQTMVAPTGYGPMGVAPTAYRPTSPPGMRFAPAPSPRGTVLNITGLPGRVPTVPTVTGYHQL